METVKRSERFSSNWPTTCNDSKTGSARFSSLAEQRTFVTSRDITNQLNRKRVKINERTVRRHLNEGGGRYNRPLLKPLLTENHRTNRLKWAHDHKAMNWNQVVFTDETTIRLNCVKENGLERTWKKTGHANCQASN